MEEVIFDKTDKGRDEVATRRHQLSPRLRPLLVMIDGKQRTKELLEKVTVLGLGESHIAELVDHGFVCQVMPDLKACASDDPASPSDAVHCIGQGQRPRSPQVDALYRFYTGTIKSNIGLRGYALQLAVEKASCVEDFQRLRKPYLDAVLEVSGGETASELEIQLDRLLAPAAVEMPAEPQDAPDRH